MKVSAKAVGNSATGVKAWFSANGRRRKPALEQPLRSELFNVEQLGRHAMALAARHELSARGERDRLLARLADNERVLLAAYRLVTDAVEGNRSLEPAAEWLLDNFHLIEEQIRTARRHLPRNYSKELPKLRHGPCAGQPRVYEIALELIAHVDGKVDEESLGAFVSAYQTVSALQLGELWAVPIMLRLSLIENLRRVAARIASDFALDRDHADLWADRMLETAEKDPRGLVLSIAEMARSGPQLSSAFVAELSRRLQGQSPALAFPLTWVEQCLSEDGLTIEQLVHTESQQQAADQVSIGNSIGSLRFLGAMDWREFVEQLSVVEQALRSDPAAVYAKMDFATRDRYRHVVEQIAKRSPLAELAVANLAIDMARANANARGAEDRTAHVGFCLIDKGAPDLERAARARTSVLLAFTRFGRRWPLACYLGPVFLVTLACTVAAAVLVHGVSLALLVPIVGFVALSASQLAVAIVNWAVPLIVKPERLPRMDFSKGIAPDARTLVAVPTMLVSPQNVADLLEGIEVHYLANPDKQLPLCSAVTDFRDAPHETMPGDDQLLETAQKGFEALNEKYKYDREDIFLLLHRPRRWNAQEHTWMGYERKRGKLADLNALLRDRATAGEFSRVVGSTVNLRQVRYVITLDTDTQLPRDAPRELVATSVHPLNRPVYDEATGTVRQGYTILQPPWQPRVSPARDDPGSCGFLAAIPASTPIPAWSPTSIRICFKRAPSSARASTTSTDSSAPWPADFRRT